jgi:2-oxoglutarate ferredoxin oxidoreductase subunit beta
MSFINKPKVAHPSLPTNALGLTRRQYEGSMSTLCAGCGHDSVTAAIVEACWGLDMRPEQLVKLSGIGCSSKTTSYFVSGAHGFNSVHGRMPSIASGANAANRELTYIGVSGDGDSLSIGLGQLAHAIRRNVNMLYVIENNGVYGLTKGQFSASADVGTKAKRGDVNQSPPIDPVLLALSLGATFVARGFSGDKAQLVPLIQAGLRHKGFAIIDAAMEADFVPPTESIAVDYPEGESIPVELHDGSRVVLRKLGTSYDPTDAAAAYHFIECKLKQNEYVTGLIHINEAGSTEFHTLNNSSAVPLNRIPYEKLSPGRIALEKLMGRYR